MQIGDIKGMNLQVGDMFEMKIENINDEGYYASLGYFRRILNEKDLVLASLEYQTTTNEDSTEIKQIRFNDIEEIKKLDYKKN